MGGGARLSSLIASLIIATFKLLIVFSVFTHHFLLCMEPNEMGAAVGGGSDFGV